MSLPRDNRNDQVRILSNGRLRVEIGIPGMYYSGSRFDWMGFMKQVELDGKHTFCIPESLKPGEGSGGEGLCGEFGIHEPIGYDEVSAGEKFPKLGIGLLTKQDDSPYFFMKPYEIDAFDVEVQWGETKADFHVLSRECGGYAVDYRKVVRLDGNAIFVEYKLANSGHKTINTTEYSHNFVRINQHEIGPEYQLTFPRSLSDVPGPEVLIWDDNRLSWRHTPQGSFQIIAKSPWKGANQGWELIHKGSGVGMRETVDFEPLRLVLWGMSHVVSPEVFKPIHLEPGETMQWTRKFEFFEL